MKFSLKQIVAAGTLLAASTGAFADVTVPAGYGNSATAPTGLTTNTDTDGGLVFYLFNSGDTTRSVSYYLGLDLTDFTFAETDQTGLTLSWTISPSAYAGADLTQMQWGLVAGDNGSPNTVSSSLLVTVASSFSSLVNTDVVAASNLVDNAYNGANEDANPLDTNIVAGSLRDTRAQLGSDFGVANFDWTADASDADATLAMYFYAQSGGRGQGGALATATEYAGLWSFDAATGVLSYSVAAVPLPAAAWLLLSALGGLGAVGRRRVAA